MTTPVSENLLAVCITKVSALELELTNVLRGLNPAALARVDAAHPMTTGGTLRQKPLVARVHALRAAINPSRAPAGISHGTRPAPPATSAAHHTSPVGAAHTISTEKLEALAVAIFSRHGLPAGYDNLSEPAKRAVLAKEFFQAHVRIPGLTDDPALAARHFRVPQLSGVPRTIAALRQRQADTFLRTTKF